MKDLHKAANAHSQKIVRGKMRAQNSKVFRMSHADTKYCDRPKPITTR